MPPAAQPAPSKRALLLIPIAVLLTIHPLLIHGPSCGQDLAFHVQSWLDAAQQLRHGTLYPRWDITAAWNAGEPRFLFYPPLSWLLGAVLTLIFPIALCPTIFIAIALLASGLTFHKLASQFASPNAALIASTLYLANPYMLFCAFERSAFAELLAAAWIPLLLLALLRSRPTPASPGGSPAAMATIRSIAIPLALLWLTNAPAAVIGSYTLALLATLRVALCLCRSSRLYSSSRLCPSDCLCFSDCHSERSEEPASRARSARPFFTRWRGGRAARSGETHSSLTPPQSPSALHLALTYLAGTLLGLTLPAVYLLPAACERRFIQTSMAIIPSLRYQDNFLFAHTADAAHNAVNHTISLLALTLLILTAAALLTLRLRTTSPTKKSLTLPLALLTAVIALLLTPISAPIWQHLPDLAYLQFPWRLLTLLTPILALSLALLLAGSNMGAPGPASGTWVRSTPNTATTAALALLLPLALTALAYPLYHQPSDPDDNPTTLARLFTTHHGFPPTDEYTPAPADNDPLRTNNPAYWLAHSPNTPAPNTLPTPTELNPSLDTDDTPIPPAQTLSTPAPHHLTLTLAQPSLLVLNLRAYPNWHITTTTPTRTSTQLLPAVPARNDGLITLQLPSGPSTLTITWHRTADQQLGLALTLLSLLALALTYLRRPARNPSA
jgi:hypothetical protein